MEFILDIIGANKEMSDVEESNNGNRCENIVVAGCSLGRSHVESVFR